MKYPKKAKICCPNCEGKGYVEVTSDQLLPRSPYLRRQDMREIRNKLRKLNSERALDGLSLRKIGKLIGINSPQQVKHHLLMIDKLGWEDYEK
jgi:ribosomal protein L44E